MTQPPHPDRRLPAGLNLGRRTPVFSAATVPAGLLGQHHTTVWARLEVEQGSVVFIEEDPPWQTVATPEHPVIIIPDRRHRIEPSSEARFAVQFFERPHSTASSTEETK